MASATGASDCLYAEHRHNPCSDVCDENAGHRKPCPTQNEGVMPASKRIVTAEVLVKAKGKHKAIGFEPCR